MQLVFIELTDFIHDTPVLVAPESIAAVNGNYIHLHGGQTFSVKEDHATIKNRLQEVARAYSGRWTGGPR